MDQHSGNVSPKSNRRFAGWGSISGHLLVSDRCVTDRPSAKTSVFNKNDHMASR